MSSAAPTTEQLDDPEMGATWFYSFVGIVVFIVFVLAVSVLYFGVERDFTNERVVEEQPAFSANLRAEQTALLGQYATYAETTGDDTPIERIRIPIERAIELKAKQAK